MCGKMKGLTTEQVVENVKKFLQEQGIKIYIVDIAELDEESVLVRVYTSVRSVKKGLELSERIWKEVVPDEKYSVLVYPKE